MKYYRELVEDLKLGRIAPVYLFFGPESYLQQEAIKRIKDSILPGDTDGFNFITLDAGETPLPEIISLTSMTPLFSGKRLIVVHNASIFARPKKGAGDQPESDSAHSAGREEAILVKYLADPAPSACIVFIAGESVDKRRKLFKEIAKSGKTVEFSLLKTEDLTLWLEKQARLAGKSLAPGVADEIILRMGNGLQSLSREIQKLLDYAAENRFITMEDVITVTPPSPEEDIFAVVDAIGQRHAARAIEGINRLILQKQPPQVILSMVARQIRLILRAGEAIRSGISAGELSPRLGIHPFVAKKMASQQRNFKRKQLLVALFMLHGLDIAVKSGKQDFLPGMETLILTICKKR